MKKWVLIFMLIASPCFGADVVLNIGGFESGGLLDAQATAGSPSVQDTLVRTGSFSLSSAGAATNAVTRYNATYTSGGVASTTTETYLLIGFSFRVTDTTPSSQTNFFRVVESNTGDHGIDLALEADGDLVVVDATGTTQKTMTTPFSVDTWYYIELGVFRDNSGNGEIWIDGSSQGTFTGDFVESSSTTTGIQFWGPGSGDGTYYFDDWYIMYNDASTLPTPLANNSDGLEVFAYQSGKASQTPDTGYTTNDSTTDGNNWGDAGYAPWVDDATGPIYSGGAQDGAVAFDDTNSNGHGKGPTGGVHSLGGTIKAGKWSGGFTRSNGSGTTHTFWYGDSGSTPISTFNMSSLDGTFTYRAVVSESTTVVPSSSQSFAAGFGKTSGGRDVRMREQMATLLHLPAEAAGGRRRILLTEAF